MAKFLNTSATNYFLEELIKDAKDRLILIRKRCQGQFSTGYHVAQIVPDTILPGRHAWLLTR